MNEHYTHPPVREAFEALTRLSRDDEARQLAAMREEALRLEATLMAEAREKGIEEGRKEGRREGRDEERKGIATSLHQMGLPLDQIHRATGLFEEQLKVLLGIEDKPAS